MALLFWASFALIAYTYLGYPLLLRLLALVAPRPVAKSDLQPGVSVVLAVCNEEKTIVRRLENLLAQDYPRAKLEIILVSDGSRDQTLELARRYEGTWVTIVELAQRQGKAAALNAGIARASGELLVFCDARQSFQTDAIRQLAANFADASVGCVSGELLLHRESSGGIELEMGAYWRYEKMIRRAESTTGSVVGATGAIYAMRRSLYRDLPHGTLLDDVMSPMRVVMQGYRTIFDASALANDIVSPQVAHEWVRKVRTLAGNWQLLSLMPGLLLPWRNPCLWRFVSHKLLRLVVPVALLLLLFCGSLLTGTLYRLLTWSQCLCYALAALGGALPASRSNRAVNVCYFFLVMNAAALVGFWRWAAGGAAGVWRPAYAKGEK